MQKLLILFLVMLVTACQSNPRHYSSYPAESPRNGLTKYALSLQGTPYKYGGSSPDSGFDCSGFVDHVYKHVLGKTLPRSSKAISRIGIAEKATALRPGDLVFYNTLHKSYSHVGIYLGSGQFIHAPSSGKTVSIASMDEDYWRKRYNGARRIMP
jgi:cell wall-associated NlpC family hydrolase